MLLEDLGALIGLCFALFGVSMAEITGDPRWDGVGAIAIGVLLVIIAVFLAVEMSSMLVGESALPEQEDGIRRRASGDARRPVDHPPAHPAHRPGRAARGGQGRGRPATAPPRTWPS